MKCISCGAQNTYIESLFNCDYCGVENVRPEYFETKSAEVLNSENLAPYKNQGIRNFNLKKFKESSDQLDKYLTTNSSDSEAWIFYALSEAELLKASNVDEKFLLISEALSNAKENASDKELINNSEVVLSSKILINALDAARVYFKNSTKRFTGFGGGEHEAEQALEIITKALGFPNHRSEARINILFYGFSILRTIKKRYKIDINEYNLGFSSDLHNHLDLYVNQMEELYSHDLSKDKIDKIFSNLSGDDVSFIKKNLTLFQSGDATNSNINDQEKSGCLSKIIIWSLIIGLVGWLLDASVL